MAKPLSPRQREVLDYVTEEIEEWGDGKPPSIREIAEALGLKSPGNIHRILVELERKGYLNLRRSTTKVYLPSHGSDSVPISLTPLQARVYEFLLKRNAGDEKYVPSVREIAAQLGEASVSGVYKALVALERRKLVFLDRTQKYGVELYRPGEEALYPVVVQPVPCAVKSFLSPVSGGAFVRYLPLAELAPDFVETDAQSYFGVELKQDGQLEPFSKGDYLLLNKDFTREEGNIIAFVYQGRVLVRYYYLTRKDVSPRTIRLATRRLSFQELEDEPEERDIEMVWRDVEFMGVAVAAIVRNLQVWRPPKRPEVSSSQRAYLAGS